MSQDLPIGTRLDFYTGVLYPPFIQQLWQAGIDDLKNDPPKVLVLRSDGTWSVSKWKGTDAAGNNLWQVQPGRKKATDRKFEAFCVRLM